ncbi:MAG: SusC/RagA family TonB-linked outer membrane protein, partial [Ginsengibacter sp.]
MRIKLTNIQAWITVFILFIGNLAYGQSKQISGKITDASGAAVVGSTVAVENSTIATQTNSTGDFSLSVPASARRLIVSSIGFESQNVPINGRSEISVSLKTSVSNLNEVVVVGYGTQKRKDLTGAVSSVSAATIAKVPVTTLDQALQGRAAGVQVTSNDASPGGNISVLIRGIGSLANGGNTPLYVIDGYPTTGGINNINPNDVASIDVLKDASATAIYGIRAANGVVIITTKKGTKNKMQVSLDAYAAVQSKPKTYELLNAQEYAKLSNEVEAGDPTGNYQGLPIWHTPEQLHTIDWQDAVYRKGLTQSYNLGIRGGGENVQAAMSFGYYDQKGIIIGSYFKRYSLNLNLDYQATSWLKSSTSVKYSYQDANNPLNGFNLLNVASTPPTLDSGSRLTNQIKDGNGNYGFFNPLKPVVSSFYNPVYPIETNQ